VCVWCVSPGAAIGMRYKHHRHHHHQLLVFIFISPEPKEEFLRGVPACVCCYIVCVPLTAAYIRDAVQSALAAG
jgi:hypothetical protein